MKRNKKYMKEKYLNWIPIQIKQVTIPINKNKKVKTSKSTYKLKSKMQTLKKQPMRQNKKNLLKNKSF